MADLHTWQYVLIALIFVWSGFIRSGLGFGGAVMSLPLLLASSLFFIVDLEEEGVLILPIPRHSALPF